MNNTIMWKEIFESGDAVKVCLDKNAAVVRSAVESFKARKPAQIIFAARGTSDHASTYGKYLIETTTGIPVGLAACSVVTLYGAKVDYSNACVIGVSQSGEGQDVYEVLAAAKASGALTISITNEPESKIAKIADYHLYCACGKEISVAATKTFIMQLLLVTQFTAELSGKPELLDNIERAVRETLGRADEVAALSTRYRFMNECFVLARGLGYPLALETALKIQETCYVRARAYPVSDFQHGPFAMVENNTAVFMIAVDKATDADVEHTINRLNDVGADIYLVTNKPELFRKAATGVLLPDWCEGIPGLFAAAVCAQVFASNLSLAKGNNPDAPRGLAKVTVTR